MSTIQKPDPATLYAALVRTKSDKHAARRLTYRCTNRRCLVLDIIDAPSLGEILVHEARHKYSPQLNETRTAAEARRDKTEDGERRWLGRSYWLSTSGLNWTGWMYSGDTGGMVQSGVMLRCDHVDTRLLADDFWADWNAGHAQINVRADGHRYAV